MNTSWKRVLAFLAFAGFIASLCVHLAALSGVNVSKHIPFVWLLHIGFFLVFFPLVFSLNRKQKNDEKEKEAVIKSDEISSVSDLTWTKIKDIAHRAKDAQKKDSLSDMFGHVPRWAQMLVAVFFVYAIINFALFFFAAKDYPRGTYIVGDKNTAIAQRGVIVVTQEEYDAREARVLRGFTGHWMIFYLLPAIYFGFPQNKGIKREFEL